jgi:aminomethyltransferase
LWAILSHQFAPAGFAAIDILRIEAGLFLFTNECRISPAIAELGLSAMFDSSNSYPEIRLVAFTADTQSELDLVLWEAESAVIKRPRIGQIIVTSACFSVSFERVTGLGFIVFDDESDVFVDPENDFHNINLCSLPPYDPHKTRLRRAWQPNPW